jgi:lysophospholipase L1-like esterase
MHRTLPASLLALALTIPFAHAQVAPEGAPPAPPAPRRAAPAPLPLVPVPPALTGPVTFTCGVAKAGETSLVPSVQVFSPVAGFDLNTAPTIAGGVCSSDKPFYLSFAVPEGNYRVTAVLGGKEASVMTVRAEARRLYLDKLPIGAGKTVTREMDINVRVAEFKNPDGTPSRVRLKDREIGNLDWDAKLTLEFNGEHPAFHSVTIEPLVGAKAEPVLYLAGDSTMVDQDVEPWASWGQMLPRFFLPGIVVANHAESGESSNSFVSELRFPKIMSLIKPGDYFFVQFAHNDQKQKDFLPRYHEIMTHFVNDVRAKGATPVIVTAMNRDEFDEQGHIKDTFAGYIQAAREVAESTHTQLIDLNEMSKTMFEAMGPGPDKTDRAFMHFAANTFPGQTNAIHDNTHFNNYGAYELARCIVHGIREDKLGLEKYLDPSVPDFDPAKPDPFADFHLAFTPIRTKEDTTKIPQANLK